MIIITKKGFGTGNGFFPNPLGSHGTDRSLAMFWPFCFGAQPVPLPEPADYPGYRE